MIRCPYSFFKYLGDLLQGDFGPSFVNRDFSVSELIMLGPAGQHYAWPLGTHSGDQYWFNHGRYRGA